MVEYVFEDGRRAMLVANVIGIGHAEQTTTFERGACVHCGAASHTLYDGGQYCDGCARRVTDGQRTCGPCFERYPGQVDRFGQHVCSRIAELRG
jgi:predicted amidophosphoribosyltransferase